MQFLVHPEIFTRFPNMHLAVAVAHVVRALSRGLEQYFGVTPDSFVVDEARPAISW